MANEIYNPVYFGNLCKFAELGRSCIQPIYSHGCLDKGSVIFGEPVAFWTSQFADKVPEIPDGVSARSAVWGFEPYFFDEDEVKEALGIILFEEWKLPRR